MAKLPQLCRALSVLEPTRSETSLGEPPQAAAASSSRPVDIAGTSWTLHTRIEEVTLGDLANADARRMLQIHDRAAALLRRWKIALNQHKAAKQAQGFAQATQIRAKTA